MCHAGISCEDPRGERDDGAREDRRAEAQVADELRRHRVPFVLRAERIRQETQRTPENAEELSLVSEPAWDVDRGGEEREELDVDARLRAEPRAERDEQLGVSSA